MFLGGRSGVPPGPRRAGRSFRVHGRPHGESDVPPGLRPRDRARRGRRGHVRSGPRHLRRALEYFLADSRPDAAQSPGTRRGRSVSHRDLHARCGAAERGARLARSRAATLRPPDRNGDRSGTALLAGRRVSPALLRKERRRGVSRHSGRWPMKRLEFAAAAAALVAGFGFAWRGRASGQGYEVAHSDSEWLAILGPQRFYILRQGGTEPAFSSSLIGEKRAGVYRCAGCALTLFTS